MNFPIAPFATQTRVRRIILFVCAAIYLCSAALRVVVGLKESRRPGGGLECPAVEDMHDPGSVLLRIPLLRTRVNKGWRTSPPTPAPTALRRLSHSDQGMHLELSAALRPRVALATLDVAPRHALTTLPL